jgi:hypothetical protein
MHCIVHFRMILNRSDNLCARFVSFGNVCVLLMLLDRSNRARGWLEEAAEAEKRGETPKRREPRSRCVGTEPGTTHLH